MKPQEIEEYLQRQYTLKSNLVNNFPDEIKQTIKDYDFNCKLNLKVNLHNIFYLMKHSLTKIPTCKLNGCMNNRQFATLAKGYKNGCCAKHTREFNSLEKHGVSSPNQLDSVKNKKIDSSMKKYGTRYTLQSKEVRDKAKENYVTKIRCR